MCWEGMYRHGLILIAKYLLKIQLLIKKFTLLDSLLSLLLDYAVIDRPNEANYGSLYRTKI